MQDSRQPSDRFTMYWYNQSIKVPKCLQIDPSPSLSHKGRGIRLSRNQMVCQVMERSRHGWQLAHRTLRWGDGTARRYHNYAFRKPESCFLAGVSRDKHRSAPATRDPRATSVDG